MLANLLAIVRRDNGNWYFDGAANGIGEGLIYALIGFAVVVVGIVLIIFIIWLLGLLMKKTNNLAFLTNLKGKRKKKQPEKSAETAQPAVADGDEVPPEVKAAIIAAIMAYYEEQAPQCEFKVKRIKRI